MKACLFKYGCASAIILLGVLGLFSSAAAGDAARGDKVSATANKEPIRITADKLVTDDKAHSAEFSGNVTAIQGEVKVTAQRLILFYGSQSKKQAGMDMNSIERMVASGRVRINFDNRLAVSEQAVYTTNDRKLVLTGPGSQVTSGRNIITGSKITFNRNDGSVVIEGDPKNKVEAEIHSDQRGLN